MAVKYYAGNKLTGVASDTKPTSNVIDGSTFFVTDTEDLFMYDLGTTAWKVVSGNTIAETLSSKTLTSPVLNGTLSGTGFLDEDNFASDSAIAVASQQSIKAYVASQIPGSQNVFSTLAVSGQSDVVADAATDTLTLVAGSNMTITTAAGSDTVTFAASGSGTVTVTDNESTAENNLITFVAGAATATGAHGLEMDGDLHYNPSTGTLTSTVFVGALTGNASGTAATVTGAAQTAITSVGTLSALGVTGTVTAGGFSGPLTGNVTGDASGTAATVTGAAQTAITSVGTLTGLDLTSGNKTIFSTVGNNTLTIGASTTTVNIAGDLTVSGDSTTVNTATLSVEDPLIILASGNNAGDAVDIGLYGLYDTSGSQDLYSGLFRDANDSGKWKLFKDLQAAPTTTVNTSGTGYAVGTLVANVEGNVTGSAGSATGNAATATALATARTIGGTSFDGSAAIVPATITVADTTDTTAFVALFESATGDLAPKTDAGVTYNAGTGMLTATGFTGPVTGNVTGTAATVTGATQAAITSIANLVTVGTIGTGVWQGTAVAQAYIADAAINEAKLEVSNAPTNGYLLTARSGNAGGMTWEASSSAGASESFAIAMAVAL